MALSEVSEAVGQSGVRRKDVIGRNLWTFHDSATAAEIRQKLARCIVKQEEQRFVTVSTAGNIQETWTVHILPCVEPASAVVVGSLVHGPADISAEDRELLYALSHDQTTDDYARNRGLSRDAVHTRLRRLRARFHVKSTPGLIGVAMRLGLI